MTADLSDPRRVLPPHGRLSIVVDGVVELGDQRGRQLGFPTANIGLEDSFFNLRDGVYVGTALVPEVGRRIAAISVGRRPTFYAAEGRRLLEAHLLGFTGDLYGARLSVELSDWIREQRKFESVDELVQQLHEDAAACVRWHDREQL